jgi:hypothetical protein
MRTTRVCLTLTCLLLSATLAAHAQSSRKPGLYEVTSAMNFGAASMPPGMPDGASNAHIPPQTTQVCVTQEMIDKYGGPSPKPQHGDCQVTDISLSPAGMKAKISCTGQMTATGSVEATFNGDGSSTSTVHISGTTQMGPNPRPMNITIQSTSIYKGPDCGSVQPMPMPAAK